MALSALPSIPIRQSALFSESAPGAMTLEPMGANHLSATGEGHLDMLWPLEQWIFTVSRPGKEIHPLTHPGNFSVPPCVKVRHVILFFFVVVFWGVGRCSLYTVTRGGFKGIVFVFSRSSICFPCFSASVSIQVFLAECYSHISHFKLFSPICSSGKKSAAIVLGGNNRKTPSVFTFAPWKVMPIREWTSEHVRNLQV